MRTEPPPVESNFMDLTKAPDTHDYREASNTQKSACPNCLGLSYRTRFEREGKLSDLNKAIEIQGELVSHTPDGHSHESGRLTNLGNLYWTRCRRLGDFSDLSKAIEYHTKALLLVPNGHPDKSAMLNNLGASYVTRFKYLGELSDLGKAIELQTEAISYTPDGHADKPGRLSNLGVSYTSRFQRLGELSDLSMAIGSQAKAVLLAPDGHPDRPVTLGNLGLSHVARFAHLDEISDLTRAIELQAEAASLTFDGRQYKPEILSSLSDSYTRHFRRLSDPADLGRAIESQEEAVSLTPDGHPEKPERFSSLGVAYSARFQELGELSDLGRAIEYQAEAVSLTPDGHKDRPWRLYKLGNAYRTRFKRAGELFDIGKAIKYQAEAASLTPDGHSNKPAILGDLGTSYMTRFDRLGELSDLGKAIEFHTEALSLTPDGHVDQPASLGAIGYSYWTRFRRLGEVPDLSKAIEFQAAAVSLTPDGHPDKPSRLNNLGIAYKARFERLEEVSDLSKSIELHAAAVSLTRYDNPDRSGMLNNLGASYETRFRHLGELSDLNKAIELQAEAVSHTSDDHADRPVALNNLGFSHMLRFQRLGELSELNRAIELQGEAASLAPDDHSERPRMFNNLGKSYLIRFICLGELSDLRFAETSFKNASQSPGGPPSVRFYACRWWANLSLFDFMPSPFLAYQQAMSLIPQLVWIGTTIERRYELVTEVSSFAAEAASYAISTGKFDLALEWLEASRSIVWGQIAQLRTSFQHSSGQHSTLAEELANVGRKLEHAGSQSLPPPSVDDTGSPDLGRKACGPIELALRWESLLKEIQSIPGCEDFLSSPTANRLLSAAKAHPIAIINVHESRCDALILEPGSNIIVHLHLPNFSSGDAISARDLMFSQMRDRKIEQRLVPPRPQQSSLECLWSGVVKPILDTLGYTHKLPVDQLPRITWCTTGLLSFLPLYAARSHDESQPGAFDLVISSYTPTISALLSSQAVDPSSSCGILAVGQEHTPGLTSLPCTTRELAVIHQRAQSNCYIQLENDEATVEQVLDAMDQFSWVHMACHGSQNPYDPTKSAFHLHDGNLTLTDITKRAFTNKGLAFLSACQTATGDENMPDEAVHLAAGMLMAGYPSVIGTMWSIADEDGPEVADLVYAELLKDGKMDHTNAARALHRAVAQLREKVGVERVERWAPFIHIGA